MHHNVTLVVPIEFFDGEGNVWFSRMMRNDRMPFDPSLGMTLALYKDLDAWVHDYGFANVLPDRGEDAEVASHLTVQDVRWWRAEGEFELFCEPLRCRVANQEDAEGMFQVLKSGYESQTGWRNTEATGLEHDEVAGYDDSDDDEEGEGDVSDLPPPYEDPSGSSRREEHCSFFGPELPLWARD